MINIAADLRPITNVLGMNKAFMEDFSSQRFYDAMSSFAAETAVVAFNELMDEEVRRRPDEFGHMYDWGELGHAAGRLWQVVIVGPPSSKLVSWVYKESINEVPVGVNDQDTRKGGHIYRWKAPMVENGTRVRIEPLSPGGWLAIPTNENTGNMSNNVNRQGTMWFTKKAISPPINRIAQGAFTQAWLTHFGTVAVKIVEEVVHDEFEEYAERYDDFYYELPESKVPPKPTRSYAQIASDIGEKLGHRKNGQFMTKIEKLAQLERIKRIGEGLV